MERLGGAKRCLGVDSAALRCSRRHGGGRDGRGGREWVRKIDAAGERARSWLQAQEKKRKREKDKREKGKTRLLCVPISKLTSLRRCDPAGSCCSSSSAPPCWVGGPTGHAPARPKAGPTGRTLPCLEAVLVGLTPYRARGLAGHTHPLLEAPPRRPLHLPTARSSSPPGTSSRRLAPSLSGSSLS